MGKSGDLEIAGSFKRIISKKFRLEKMVLFGSRASGKSGKESDFDLILVSHAFRKLKWFERSPELLLEWHRRFDYPVDILCYTPEEFEERLGGQNIVSEALKNGVVI